MNKTNKHWSIDVTELKKDEEAFIVWNLEQHINWGIGEGKINRKDLLKYWNKIDLDIFSEKEFNPEAISTIFKKIQKDAKIKSVKYEQSFNRNLFFLELENDFIKTEFTYFPFPRIEVGGNIGNLKIDSLLDIAVNKVFTIHQKPRSRDFIDLYLILKLKPEWNIDELVKKAHIKFDNYLDPLQLSAQFVKVDILKDHPKMVTKISEKKWQEFFMHEARKLSANQLQ